MNINKQTLIKALETVKPGLASKEMIEQTTSFCFKDGKVITYNDEISISCPVEGLDLEGAISAEELYKLLSKIKKDEIDLEIEENEILIKSGRMKAYLTLQDEIKLPLEEISGKKKWKDLPKRFSEALKFAAPTCSKDMSYPSRTCVHITKQGTVEATDSYRFSINEINEMPVNDFLLPSSEALQLIKLKPTKVSEGKGWIHFKNENEAEISCRVYEDQFPDVHQFVEVEGNEIELPKKILDILERAEPFYKRDYFLDEGIEVSISTNQIKISATGDHGRFEEDARIDYDKKEHLNFNITPYILRDIVEKTRKCIISDKMIKFAGENWIYIATLRFKNQ